MPSGPLQTEQFGTIQDPQKTYAENDAAIKAKWMEVMQKMASLEKARELLMKM